MCFTGFFQFFFCMRRGLLTWHEKSHWGERLRMGWGQVLCFPNPLTPGATGVPDLVSTVVAVQ